MDTYEGLKRLACHYRLCNQLKKCLEEIGELQEAIEGYMDGNDTKDHVIEEIADVEVMTAQLKILLDAEMMVEKTKEFKVNRQLNRISRGC
jgi:NTP pyrophosphatase (non-canonical NTP hydrolase)